MPTENQDYNIPDKGTTDWHIPLNENFKNIDTDVLLRDAESNLGNYTPKTGAAFLATDTGKVFVGDGSTWNPLGFLSPVNISVQTSEPSSPSDGDVWIDPG